MAGLVSYSSSSDSENDEGDADQKSQLQTEFDKELDEGPNLKRPRRVPTDTVESHATSLPLPGSILNMFTKDKDEDPLDNPDSHGGRQRTFAHQRGNWASFVYAEVPEDARLQELVRSLLSCLRTTADFTQQAELHLTLSHTVILKHHWIEPFVSSLRTNLASCRRCHCHMSGVKFYTNDERTRTFLGLCIDAGKEELQEYVVQIDKSLTEFKLPTYYKNPSFHVSIAWCLGDITTHVDKLRSKLQGLVDEFFTTYPSLAVLDITELVCKTGNKLYQIPLS